LRRTNIGGFTRDRISRRRRVFMTTELADAIEIRGNFVLLIERGREANDSAPNARIVNGLRTVGKEAVRDVLVNAPVAVRSEEPEPILLDGSALGRIEVPHFVERVWCGEAGFAGVARIVGLHALVRA